MIETNYKLIIMIQDNAHTIKNRIMEQLAKIG